MNTRKLGFVMIIGGFALFAVVPLVNTGSFLAAVCMGVLAVSAILEDA